MEALRDKKLPKATAKRLPAYLRHLKYSANQIKRICRNHASSFSHDPPGFFSSRRIG